MVAVANLVHPVPIWRAAVILRQCSGSVHLHAFLSTFAWHQVKADPCWFSWLAPFQELPVAVREPISRVLDGLVEFTLEQLLGQHLDPVGGDTDTAFLQFQ